jgi:hypothetical protein
MKQTAVEWLDNSIIVLEERLRLKEININDFIDEKDLLVEQAKEMEKKEKLKRQLFIGKVSDIIGFKKTVELWKETLNAIK